MNLKQIGQQIESIGEAEQMGAYNQDMVEYLLDLTCQITQHAIEMQRVSS